MPDTFSSEQRSEIMRRVKGRDTSLERRVRSALHRRGLRFRLNSRLPGKPDLVFARAQLALFLDSCFWHGCPEHLRMPASHQDYWTAKIVRNRERDGRANDACAALGWRVLRVWEHDLKTDFDGSIRKIEQAVRNRR